jgi:hypothetical protein
MLEFFNLPLLSERVALTGRRNQSIGYKAENSSYKEDQLSELISQIPERYLEIFRHEPYSNFGWADQLRRAEAKPSLHHAH